MEQSFSRSLSKKSLFLPQLLAQISVYKSLVFDQIFKNHFHVSLPLSWGPFSKEVRSGNMKTKGK